MMKKTTIVVLLAMSSMILCNGGGHPITITLGILLIILTTIAAFDNDRPTRK